MTNTYTLSTRVFLDKTTQCYSDVITINRYPVGPLASITRRVQFPPLSTFQQYGSCNSCNSNDCGYAIISTGWGNGGGGNVGKPLMCVGEIGDLFSFLVNKVS